MKIKIISNKESYGFQGKFWIKGECTDIEKDEEYPKDHFDVVGKEHGPEDDLDPEIKSSKPTKKK